MNEEVFKKKTRIPDTERLIRVYIDYYYEPSILIPALTGIESKLSIPILELMWNKNFL